jgi:phosphatidylglycerophosphate synthase
MPEMKPDLSLRSAPDLLHAGPVAAFAGYALGGAGLVVAVVVALVGLSGPALVLALAGYGLGVGLATLLMRRGFEHPTVGACNVVTLTRMAVAAGLLGTVAASGAPPLTVFGLAAFGLSLDGIDGWLARRGHRASAFGARFDMEVDSALALILALHLWTSGVVGAGVLLIGLPRYGFAAAGAIWPWLDRPLPDRFSRKVVCVIQIGALIALVPQVVSPQVGTGVVVAVAAALVWSFGRDILWLRRNRA